MDLDLISKKELLELADISYGQLYRWKRKNLIPEEWFIRKSTFTGQETFFPKEKILSRIDKIKNMKDDLSLDRLADMFSPVPSEISLSSEELLKRNIVTKHALELHMDLAGVSERYSFETILHVYLLDRLLQTGEISLEEGRVLLLTLQEHAGAFEGGRCQIILTRKMGVSQILLLSHPGDIRFEKQVKVAARIVLADSMEELKLLLS